MTVDPRPALRAEYEKQAADLRARYGPNPTKAERRRLQRELLKLRMRLWAARGAAHW